MIDLISGVEVTRANLEYPTVDVSFSYLAAIEKLAFGNYEGILRQALLTSDSFADKALENWGFGDQSLLVARWINKDNQYLIWQDSGALTLDFRMGVFLAAAITFLASEAIDLTADDGFLLKLKCTGSTIEAFRTDMVTPKISVTDTTHASGRFGVTWGRHLSFNPAQPMFAHLRGSPITPRKAISSFEVPIIGSGTQVDPYRAKMPEEIVTDPVFGAVNRLALSHSSLIPVSGVTGRPLNTTALVRVFDQPDRQPHLKPITDSLTALRAGGTELTPARARGRAKALDPKLGAGEIENMFDPTPENELSALCDFYEREVFVDRRVNPMEIPDFNSILAKYEERAEKVGRADLWARLETVRRITR